MDLILDAGNSRIDGGLFADDNCIFRFELDSRRNWTGDELGISLRQLLREGGHDPKTVRHVGLCSVIALSDPLREATQRWFGTHAFVVSADGPSGLRYDYHDARQLGADRIANAEAARHLHPGRDLLIVDAGTATTVDAVSASGVHHGGAILPGIGLWAQVLRERTAALPLVTVAVAPEPVGRSTRDNIASGLYFGHLGAIRELTTRIGQTAFGADARPFILGSGGAATLFAEAGVFDAIDPALTLAGTRQLLRRSLSTE